MAAVALFVLSSLIMAVTVQAQDCSKPKGGPNSNLRDEDIVMDTFPNNKKVRLRCDVGYASVGGSSVITCHDGVWTKVLLQCERKYCGTAGEVENGKISYQGTQFGDTAVVKCDKGYTLVGNPNLICGNEGWTGRLPVCEGMKCFSPPEIANGYFHPYLEAYNYRDVVTYSCNNDYTLEGEKQSMCTEKGEFHPRPSRCKPQDCSIPGGGSNMHLKGDDLSKLTFPHESTVTFECNVGFDDVGGSPQSTCTAGRWSSVMLKCEIKNCGPLGDVANGEVKAPWTEYGDVAEITCARGYRLVGNKTIACGENGWTSKPPTCQEVKCAAPPAVANGSYQPVKEVYSFEEAVTITCNDGYELHGKQTLKCSINDEFTSPPPQCNPKGCSEPKGGSNMHLKSDHWFFTPHKFPHGSNATFECNTGFRVAEGSPQSTCTRGVWSPVTLKCEMKTCGPIPEVQNGIINYNGTEFGDKARVTCNTGYKATGSGVLTCGDQGWMGRLPTCEVVKCVHPPKVANGYFSPKKESFNFTSVVTYSCDKGYTLNGSKLLNCSENGDFIPSPPKCVLVACKDPVIPNGEWVEGSQPPHKYKALVRYQCKDGFTMKGSDTLTCEINSQWSPGIPQCIKAV